MQPFSIDDHHGATLSAGECADAEHGYLMVTSETGVTVSVCIDPLEIPDLTNALYRAASAEPPVMLGRPFLCGRQFQLKGAWAERTRGGAVQVHGSEAFLPSQARVFAAGIVALADLPDEAETRPEDPAVMLARDIAGITAMSPDIDGDGIAKELAARGWKNGDGRG